MFCTNIYLYYPCFMSFMSLHFRLHLFCMCHDLFTRGLCKLLSFLIKFFLFHFILRKQVILKSMWTFAPNLTKFPKGVRQDITFKMPLTTAMARVEA